MKQLLHHLSQTNSLLSLPLPQVSTASMAANSTFSSPLMGPPSLQLIEEITQNTAVVQQNLLAQILAQNAEAEYLRSFGGPMDVETFKSKVPMVTYQDIQPLIQRMADGDRSPILCAHPIDQFLFSSGTSGDAKLIPYTKEVKDRTLLACALINPLLRQRLKGQNKGKRLEFLFTRPERKTQGGAVVRTALTSLHKSEAFKKQTNLTSPLEAIYCTDTFQSMYVQMLCGLYERTQVFLVGTTFASGLVRAIGFLQHNWQHLAHDIRTGLLDSRVSDPSVREYMTTKVMRPDSDLADSISHECAKGDWSNIIPRIWHNVKYLAGCVTGTMAQYIPTLDLYGGGLPILCMLYASTETFFGINLNPMCKPSEVSYTFMPFLAYFEFLPYKPNSQDLTHSDLVNLVNIKVGEEYEIVTTTLGGLYRYRIGDIVRATGFYNSAPQFQFVMRKNVLLNIDGEKTTEFELHAAVGNVSRLLHPFGTSVVDYSSFTDTSTIPGHYVIYLELLIKDNSLNLPSDEVLGRCCQTMEESFNTVYILFRASDKSIGPLEIRVVRRGTFEELMDNEISKGALSINQYKVPRCVKSKSMLNHLDSRVVSTHISPSLPRSSSQ